jgi:hypothetical protein
MRLRTIAKLVRTRSFPLRKIESSGGMMTGFEAILLVGASTVATLIAAYFVPA